MPIRWKHELQDMPAGQGAKRHYFTVNDGDRLLLHAIYQSGAGRGDRMTFELPSGATHAVLLPIREGGVESIAAAVRQVMEIQDGDQPLSAAQQGAALFMLASVSKLQSTQYGLEFEIPIPAQPTEAEIRNTICDPFMMAASSALAKYAAARFRDQILPSITDMKIPPPVSTGKGGYLWRHKIQSSCRNWGSKLHWFEFSPAADPGYGLIGFQYASGPKTGTKLTLRTSDTILDEEPMSPRGKTIDIATSWEEKYGEKNLLNLRRIGENLVAITSLAPQENIAGYPPHAGQYMGLIMMASLYNLLSTRYDKPFDWAELPPMPTGKTLEDALEDKAMAEASRLAGKVATELMARGAAPFPSGVLTLIGMTETGRTAAHR